MVAWQDDFREGICVSVIHGSCLGGLVRSDSLSLGSKVGNLLCDFWLSLLLSDQPSSFFPPHHL